MAFALKLTVLLAAASRSTVHAAAVHQSGGAGHKMVVEVSATADVHEVEETSQKAAASSTDSSADTGKGQHRASSLMRKETSETKAQKEASIADGDNETDTEKGSLVAGDSEASGDIGGAAFVEEGERTDIKVQVDLLFKGLEFAIVEKDSRMKEAIKLAAKEGIAERINNIASTESMTAVANKGDAGSLHISVHFLVNKERQDVIQERVLDKPSPTKLFTAIGNSLKSVPNIASAVPSGSLSIHGNAIIITTTGEKIYMNANEALGTRRAAGNRSNDTVGAAGRAADSENNTNDTTSGVADWERTAAEILWFMYWGGFSTLLLIPISIWFCCCGGWEMFTSVPDRSLQIHGPNTSTEVPTAALVANQESVGTQNTEGSQNF